MITVTEAAQMLLSQANITLLCHSRPDGDTTGSAIGLARGLTQLGKNVRVRCADPFPPTIARLIGVPTQCEPPGGPEPFVVAVDVADHKLLGALAEEYAGRIDLCIDHHPSNKLFAKATCLAPHAAAAAQLVAELLAAMNVTLTAEIATPIYVALATDSGCFRFASTTAATLRAAADMLEAGVVTEEINRELFETKTPGRVALECAVLQSIEYYCDGHCAMITIPTALTAQCGVAKSELDGIAGLSRQIEGVWAGVTVWEEGELCRVSVRTTSQADASAICAAFEGGGHMRAGGCTIRGSMAEVKKLLAMVIEKHLGERQ